MSYFTYCITSAYNDLIKKYYTKDILKIHNSEQKDNKGIQSKFFSKQFTYNLYLTIVNPVEARNCRKLLLDSL